MGLDKNLLFTDQYIEIQLTSIKENRKKQIATSSYSILIEQQNSMFRKKIKNKVATKKLSTYQVKKLIVLIGKLKPIIRSNADEQVEYDLHIKSKGNNYENINLRHRWTTKPQVMRDLFERTFWYKEPHQKLTSYIEQI
ncbi:hypothetical protein [Candidatus Methylopumilus rimovensis]|uniref:hypothetical protein n=1 Tax=Candidatus Methylopumilus rimovensis TaxID=2588535 RepID=UPI001120AF9F|nr:hypothetical protein [Candidatus Methylopumilus rimovensis]QDD11869.1 hypothetical protein FIT62_01650 [Candidatus Methylopumilus rimovensis]